MRMNQTCTGRRENNGRSRARPLQNRPGRYRGNAHQSRRPGPAVEGAFPGLSGMQQAKAGDRRGPVWRWDSLAGVAGGVAGAPGIQEPGAAFSPAKGIAVGYAEVVDA